MTQTSLPTPGQHIIARRGTSQLEGTVKKVKCEKHLLIVVELPNANGLHSLEYNLWGWDGWVIDIVPEPYVVVDGALA